jgi:D-alanyl-lipoteichoic acid acyltransferase DltB (MBOAT superfamily)
VLFNSFSFLFFLLIVSAVHFWLPHRWQWLWLLAASCFFYMQFIPVYILILFLTIVIDYYAAIWISETDDPIKKKRYLTVSILSVCAVLAVFKYFNFFNANFAMLARMVGWNYPVGALRIILPIGLSFHTFQSLSYVIEVYRGKQKPERHFGVYALYVMYFPQLVAGPIERPQNLLPQFHRERPFDWQMFRDGLLLATWGLFKKVVIADCVAQYVDAVYDNSVNHGGTSLLLATYFFAIQIYCDFSGYSDIARGVSRIFGIELMKNFETPYFSRSISEFWSRWHISLSSWFKDYVYIPLGGNRVPLPRNLVNLFTVFLLSGFWHGANWTFIAWGALHGTYLVIERCAGLWRPKFLQSSNFTPAFAINLLKIAFTFHLVLISWVLFRAASLHEAIDIFRKIAFEHGPLFWNVIIIQGAFVIAILAVWDLFHQRTKFWDRLPAFPASFRVACAFALLFGIVLFGIESQNQFIYFQF